MPENISPGIVQVVERLRSLGYETTDSGDGTNHANGMGCALPFRHVFGVMSDEESCDMVGFAKKLQDLFPESRVEVSYAPGEVATFMLLPDGYPDDVAVGGAELPADESN